jgi:TonB family protein
LSFDIEITTTPADLEGLGLENRGADEPEDVQEAAGQDKEKILLTDLIIPSYPPLARTGRVQGEVKVALEFDSKCRVSASQIVAGHPLLNSAVLKAVQDWHLPSCTAGERNVNATFRFVLAEPDEPSYDDWAPTHIEIAGPYEFEIRTTAPYPFVYD